MGPKEEVVIVWAVMPKEAYSKFVLPKGCYGQAVSIGEADQLIDQKECKSWGGTIAMSLYAWAKKMFPESEKSNLILLGKR